MSRCICEFPPTCDGSGIKACLGCGGDQCVCAACGSEGEQDCLGCSLCDDENDDDTDLGIEACE